MLSYHVASALWSIDTCLQFLSYYYKHYTVRFFIASAYLIFYACLNNLRLLFFHKIKIDFLSVIVPEHVCSDLFVGYYK